MSLPPEEREQLLKECEEADRERGQSLDEQPYEEWDDYRDMASPPDDPPRRVVVLDEGRQDAVFEGKELTVYTVDADTPIKLYDLDPTGKTDEELRQKIKLRLLFG